MKVEAHRAPAASNHRYMYKTNIPFYATNYMCYSSLFGHHIKSNHIDQLMPVSKENNKNLLQAFLLPQCPNLS